MISVATAFAATLSLAYLKPSPFGSPKILKFQGGADAAVSLQFDDSMTTQLQNAVPLLDARKIRATFFVITGSWQYGQHKHAWEIDLPKAGHEIANHTVHHTGAKNVEELQEEIGGCSEYLATVFGPKPRLVSFAIPGGVPWNFTREQLDPIFQKYHLVLAENRNFFDEKTTDPVKFVQTALDKGTWTNVAMHGVGGEWLSTGIPTLTRLLDFMVANRDRLWIAPEIEVYKYVQERDAASMPILKAKGPNRFTLVITCDQSKLAFKDLPVSTLYDEPLTVEVPVPSTWMSFRVKQGPTVATYKTKQIAGETLATFQLLPNQPPATISQIAQ